ncbi:MAG: folate-binding protein [Burkholderiaceae bacterium]|nr:folate-binding protein [Burkholderiaceae bacterium]MCD8516313.1 folate-binding protein [Burkholderiaceae bacterium]MCD8537136.1 folate-binding protein [Burkholderiaceae bacterium]MCD8564325.1 folate-binding protein [Burkholderiaceae bacterium]
MSSFSAPVILTRCDHLAVFAADGIDASTFLQSQLTQDVASVSPEKAAMAGFCTAQGRLWASMLLTQTTEPEGFRGVVSSDLMESFLKRLRMFVLRSKVAINPMSQTQVYGLEISANDLEPMSALLGLPLPPTPWASVTSPLGTWLNMPGGKDYRGIRCLWLASTDQFDQLLSKLGEHAQLLASANAWRVQDIKAGLPWVEQATQDLFIAQTLNLDLIGGVSFTKGCYPGQEVIARAHYRGTVKRRMHMASITGTGADLKPGMDVFEASEPDNPVGRLISVAQDDQVNETANGLTWVLFEAPFKSLDSGSLRAGSNAGPELSTQLLPYEMTA